MAQNVSVIVYTPANMNAIDGSSVWAQTITLAFAGVENVDVTLLLSHAVTTDRMLGPLLEHRDITVVDPIAAELTDSDPLTLDQAAHILSGMTVRGPQAIVVRGADAAHRLARQRALKGRLWPYLTDVPQRVEDIDEPARKRMSTIMSASPVLLCQTIELQEFLESQFPGVTGKTRLYPPAIPGHIVSVELPPPTKHDLRLCYSGKFARMWNTYEMCDLPSQLAERDIKAKLTMVGDKINRDPHWPKFVAEMRAKLESSPGVDWVGGVSRERSIGHMSSAHMGLSWRSPELDESLELSTKLLEYCAAGTPPILNRTAMHERIFGNEYPLFVDAHNPILDLIQSVTERSDIYERALHSVSSIAADYTLDRASHHLSEIIADTLTEPRLQGRSMWKAWAKDRRAT